MCAGFLHARCCQPFHCEVGAARAAGWRILLLHVRFGLSLCVFYYCMTYYKAVRVGGERTCAMRDDEPRPVWISLPITH